MKKLLRAAGATLASGVLVTLATSGPAAAASVVPQVISVQSSPSGHVSMLVRTPGLARELHPGDFAVTPASATGPVSAAVVKGSAREVNLLVDVGTSPKVASVMVPALVKYVQRLPLATRIAIIMPNGLTPLVAPGSSDITHTIAALRAIRTAGQGDPAALVTTAIGAFSATPGRARTLVIAAARDAGLQTSLAAAGSKLSSRHIELAGVVAAAAVPGPLVALGLQSSLKAVPLRALPTQLGRLRASLIPTYRVGFQRHPTTPESLRITIRGAGAADFLLPAWHRNFGISSASVSLLSTTASWVIAVLVALLVGLLVTWDALIARGRSANAAGRGVTLSLGAASIRLVPAVAVLGVAAAIALALRLLAILQ